MNDIVIDSTAKMTETVVLDLKSADGVLKQRTTIKDGVETIETFPKETE